MKTITLCCGIYVATFAYEGWGGLVPSGMTSIYVNPRWVPRCEQVVGWIRDDCLRGGWAGRSRTFIAGVSGHHSHR